MNVRTSALRIAPLATVLALSFAAPAMAESMPAPVKTTISDVTGNLTVPAPTVGVNDHLSARLTAAARLGGKALTFTTVATANTPATLLCTATTDATGVGACDALVGLDPTAISTTGLAQIAAKGSFTVAFAGDATFLASTAQGASTFYGSPALPGTSANR